MQRTAHTLSCTVQYVYTLIREGRLKAIKIGQRAIRVSEPSLKAFIRANVIDPGEYFAPPELTDTPNPPVTGRSTWTGKKGMCCVFHHVGDLVHKDIRDGEIAYQLIVNAALCAKDPAAGAFGFNQHWDVRKYKPDRPFRLNTWAGGVIGVIGRDIRFLDRHLFKVDVDFFLENLLRKRIVWIENRFSFVQVRDRNRGGNSLFRTEEKVQEEIDFLKRK